jgi:hypothetical protein
VDVGVFHVERDAARFRGRGKRDGTEQQQ